MQIRPTAFTIGLIIYSFIHYFTFTQNLGLTQKSTAAIQTGEAKYGLGIRFYIYQSWRSILLSLYDYESVFS